MKFYEDRLFWGIMAILIVVGRISTSINGVTLSPLQNFSYDVLVVLSMGFIAIGTIKLWSE